MDSCAPLNIDQILEKLQTKIGAKRYASWFGDKTRVELQPDRLMVFAPNAIVQNWLRKYYAGELSESVREVVEQDLPVIFEVEHRPAEITPTERKTLAPAKTVPPPVLPARVAKLRYRLEDFIVGPSNRLAYYAALRVGEGQRDHLNPLFVHGGCGLGKTHLLQGLCNALGEKKTPVRWCYISGEQFTNQFVESVQRGRTDSFRKRFRHVDLLVIDDIHFLAGKKATQEEFLHTFNAIEGVGKQVVIASDRHPRDLGEVCEQLVSRFLCGMVVRIDPPDRQTRLTIAQQWARNRSIQMTDEVLAFVADNFMRNVREIEGAMIKLAAYSGLVSEPITPELAVRALSDHLRLRETVSIPTIMSAVQKFFGVSAQDIRSRSKTRAVTLARQIAIYLARRHTSMSFPEIARAIAGAAHAIAVHATHHIDKELTANATISWQNHGSKHTMSLADVVQIVERDLTTS